MPRRDVLRTRRAHVPIGDMRHIVDVCRAASVPRSRGKTEKALTVIRRSYMAIDAVEPGQADIGQVNTLEVATHHFRCRFTDQITSELVLRHKGFLYEILSATDFDGTRRFMQIRARQTGAVDREAAEA